MESSSPTPPEETVPDLISRLKDPKGDLIELKYSSNPTAKGILIQRAFLSSISPWFKNALAPNVREGNDRYIRFGDASINTAKTFIFWLFHGDAPSIDDFEGQLESEVDYQKLLIQAWRFADEHLVPKMQNAIVKSLIESWGEDGQELTLGVLQFALPITRRGSMLRKALLDEAICLEEEKRGDEMLDRLIRIFVDGYQEDLKNLRRDAKEREGRRGRAEAYFLSVS